MAEWLTTDEASRTSGYSVTYLRSLIRQKKIKAEKKGGQFWVDRDSLLAYVKESAEIDDRRHGAKGKPPS